VIGTLGRVADSQRWLEAGDVRILTMLAGGAHILPEPSVGAPRPWSGKLTTQDTLSSSGRGDEASRP